MSVNLNEKSIKDALVYQAINGVDLVLFIKIGDDTYLTGFSQPSLLVAAILQSKISSCVYMLQFLQDFTCFLCKD